MKSNIADAVKGVLGKSFEMGKCDCFTTVFINVLEKTGRMSVPDEWRGYTKENYAQLWERDPGKARRDYMEFIQINSHSIDVKFIKVADLLLIDSGNGGVTVGLYMGSLTILLPTENHGIVCAPMWRMKDKIIEARRINEKI